MDRFINYRSFYRGPFFFSDFRLGPDPVFRFFCSYLCDGIINIKGFHSSNIVKVAETTRVVMNLSHRIEEDCGSSTASSDASECKFSTTSPHKTYAPFSNLNVLHSYNCSDVTL